MITEIQIFLTATEASKVKVKTQATGEGLNSQRDWQLLKALVRCDSQGPRKGSQDAHNTQFNLGSSGHMKVKRMKQNKVRCME